MPNERTIKRVKRERRERKAASTQGGESAGKQLSPVQTSRGEMRVSDAVVVSTLWVCPPKPIACFVLAHGAGAGMSHALLENFASGIADHDIASLRYQFPYMERGSRRPDAPPVCHATVRAAVAEAAHRTGVPLIAGGRSFGGRMTSQAQALAALPGVQGLAYLGFPLHPAKKPATDRAEHLSAIRIPQLFLQGSRDELADLKLLQSVISSLGSKAVLHLIADANHAFHMPARTGRTDAMVLDELIRAFGDWVTSRIAT